MDTPTWKNTLHDSIRGFGDSGEFAETVNKLGYQYMCWNDRIYSVVKEDGRINFRDTGLNIEDLATISIKKRTIVVAGRAGHGEPVMESYKVAYTPEQEVKGAHYDKAILMAEADGMRSPFICYDEKEYHDIIRIAKRLNNSQ